MPNTVTVLQWQHGVAGDVVATAARRWAASARMHALVVRRPLMTVLLTDGVPEPTSLYRAIAADTASAHGSIGVGSAAVTPSELPRSLAEAQQALQVQRESMSPYGGRRFEDLGLYRILDLASGRPELDDFVMEWLGPLLSYDRRKNADLVATLTHYLDCGGNYDDAAQSLTIHRSTLRYRQPHPRDLEAGPAGRRGSTEPTSGDAHRPHYRGSVAIRRRRACGGSGTRLNPPSIRTCLPRRSIRPMC